MFHKGSAVGLVDRLLSGGRQRINGAHVVIYSENAEADRALFKDVLKFSFVDARDGWLIFRLPPAEVAVHPSDEDDMHELYLMTDDLDAEMAALRQTRVPCEEATQSLGPRHADQAPRRRNLGTLSAAPRAALNLGCGVRMRAPLPAMSGRRMPLPRFTKAASRLRVPARSYDVVVMSGRSATRAGAGIVQIAGKEMDGRMYYQVVIQCMKSLKNLEAWLDKAEQHAAAKKFDVGVLLNGRLAPDQKPFIYQVQSACDYVKLAAGWLSGQMPPKHPDTEQTIGDLRARIQKTVAFVESIGESQYAGVSDRKVSLSWAPGKVMAAPDYLLQMTIPNTYFHLTTAYSILRHNGVDVGKMDFLGPIKLVEA